MCICNVQITLSCYWEELLCQLEASKPVTALRFSSVIRKNWARSKLLWGTNISKENTWKIISLGKSLLIQSWIPTEQITYVRIWFSERWHRLIVCINNISRLQVCICEIICLGILIALHLLLAVAPWISINQVLYLFMTKSMLSARY